MHSATDGAQYNWCPAPFEIPLPDGRKVLVAAHSAQRWQELEPALMPFILSFAELFDAGHPIIQADALNRMALHLAAVLPCVLEASGLDLAGLEELGTDLAVAMLCAWWATNGAFHVCRIHYMRAMNPGTGTHD
ncbi:MAG TPA: hypothetical protein PK306_05680 [Aquabacterium sp.]|nr:hypothetical protein [Aquabacterium sp.]